MGTTENASARSAFTRVIGPSVRVAMSHHVPPSSSSASPRLTSPAPTSSHGCHASFSACSRVRATSRSDAIRSRLPIHCTIAYHPTARITAMTGKLVYLARRNPVLNHEEFARRWVKHATNVSAGAPEALTEIRMARYCLVESGAEYDGVGLLSLESLNSIPTMHRALVGTEVSLADELRTFSTFVKDFTVYCDAQILRDAPP